MDEKETYALYWHDNLLRTTESLEVAEAHLTDDYSHYHVIVNGKVTNSVYREK